MANFFRLILLFFGVLFCSFSAFALSPVSSVEYRYSTGPWSYSTAEALRLYCASYDVSGCFHNTQYNELQGYRADGSLTGFGTWKGFTQQTVSACPANSSSSGSSCACDSGFVEDGGACIAPVVDHPVEAKAVADGLNLAKSPLCFSGAPALQTCFAGYVIKGGFAGTAAPDANGPRSCIFPNFTADGTTCNPLPDAAASPSTCQGGKVPGTVNGIDVCVEPGKTVAPGSTSSSGSETTNPDSTKTPGDAAQSSGQTSCTGTSCTTTTTTTTTKPDGSITVTTHDKTEPKDSFCESNPASPLCAKSSFSSSCGGPASCTGDAIQCAIAQEQHKRGCRLFDDVSPESQLYEANKGKEGNQTGSLPGNEVVGIAGRINTSDALGGGSAGVADLHVTVWGQSITLPFSMLNPYLAALGNVLLAVSFLLALRIVARG